jgi:4-diphosphocytidyl-2-C-methyl-D-erythritol kinase
MSGTGPTAFGLFEDETAAREAYAQLKEQYKETYLAETV